MEKKIEAPAIIDALSTRYAVKVFDTTKQVTDADLHSVLEAGRLSVSENGFEPWEFIVVENPEIRAKLRAVSYDQPKVTEASKLIVLARRFNNPEKQVEDRLARAAAAAGIDASTMSGYKAYLESAIKPEPQTDSWAAGQTFIALGTMVLAASLLGIDNGPMSGFDPNAVDEILDLRKQGLASTAYLTLGYRGEDADAAKPKVRRSFEDVVAFVK